MFLIGQFKQCEPISAISNPKQDDEAFELVEHFPRDGVDFIVREDYFVDRLRRSGWQFAQVGIRTVHRLQKYAVLDVALNIARAGRRTLSLSVFFVSRPWTGRGQNVKFLPWGHSGLNIYGCMCMSKDLTLKLIII